MHWKLFVDEKRDPGQTVECPDWRVRNGLSAKAPDTSALGEWKIARTWGQARDFMEEFGNPSFISFDADFNDGKDAVFVAYSMTGNGRRKGDQEIRADFAFEIHHDTLEEGEALRGVLDDLIARMQWVRKYRFGDYVVLSVNVGDDRNRLAPRNIEAKFVEGCRRNMTFDPSGIWFFGEGRYAPPAKEFPADGDYDDKIGTVSELADTLNSFFGERIVLVDKLAREQRLLDQIFEAAGVEQHFKLVILGEEVRRRFSDLELGTEEDVQTRTRYVTDLIREVDPRGYDGSQTATWALFFRAMLDDDLVAELEALHRGEDPYAEDDAGIQASADELIRNLFPALASEDNILEFKPTQVKR